MYHGHNYYVGVKLPGYLLFPFCLRNCLRKCIVNVAGYPNSNLRNTNIASSNRYLLIYCNFQIGSRLKQVPTQASQVSRGYLGRYHNVHGCHEAPSPLPPTHIYTPDCRAPRVHRYKPCRYLHISGR